MSQLRKSSGGWASRGTRSGARCRNSRNSRRCRCCRCAQHQPLRKSSVDRPCHIFQLFCGSDCRPSHHDPSQRLAGTGFTRAAVEAVSAEFLDRGLRLQELSEQQPFKVSYKVCVPAASRPSSQTDLTSSLPALHTRGGALLSSLSDGEHNDPSRGFELCCGLFYPPLCRSISRRRTGAASSRTSRLRCTSRSFRSASSSPVRNPLPSTQ